MDGRSVFIAIDGWVRTGCRGGTPGWGQRPHTPFDPHVLNVVTIAIVAVYETKLHSLPKIM